ncbi:hypothetical protein MMC12_007680 [Toensbergia leucococca]|nr:hypothetical protein [Toensbergia leucococca]
MSQPSQPTTTALSPSKPEDVCVTTTWGPHTYHPREEFSKSDLRRMAKNGYRPRRDPHREITLSGSEETSSTEKVEDLGDGGVKTTWTTFIKLTAVELEKRV